MPTIPAFRRRTQRPHGGVPATVTGVGALTLALLVAPPLVPDAAAAREVTASFGVLGRTTLHATATTSGIPGGARILLEGRSGGRSVAVRDRSTVKGGVARLSWTFPRRGSALHVRVRVVRGGRTLAASGWRILRTGGLTRGARLAPVRPVDVVSAPDPGRRGDLVVRGRPALQARDVVVLPSTPRTPDGLLVRVRGIRRDGASTVARTEPARLPDVMPVGDLSLSAAASAPPSADGTRGVGRFAGAISCDAPSPATVTGAVTLSVGLRLRTAWRASSSLQRPNVTTDLRTDVRAAIDAGVAATGGARCALPSRPLFSSPLLLRRISTSIGPLPLTLTVDGQVGVSASTATLGAVSTAVRGTVGARTRTRYDGIEATQTGRLTTRLRPRDTRISASGGVQVGVTPAVEVRVFGLAGPGLDFAAGTRTTADIAAPTGTPWWRTTVPDELGATFALQAWRGDLESPRVRLEGHDGELTRATRPPGGSSQSGFSGAPGPLPDGVATRVTWDSDAELELHAWDPAGRHVWAGNPEAIAGVTVRRTRIADAPGVQIEVSDPALPLTIGVCQVDGTESRAVVDARGADGGVVRRTVVLRGRRAAALPVVVPFGAAPSATSGDWCGLATGEPTVVGRLSTGDLPSGRPRASPGRAAGGSDASRVRVRQNDRVTTGTQEHR